MCEVMPTVYTHCTMSSEGGELMDEQMNSTLNQCKDEELDSVQECYATTLKQQN